MRSEAAGKKAGQVGNSVGHMRHPWGHTVGMETSPVPDSTVDARTYTEDRTGKQGNTCKE